MTFFELLKFCLGEMRPFDYAFMPGSVHLLEEKQYDKLPVFHKCGVFCSSHKFTFFFVFVSFNKSKTDKNQHTTTKALPMEVLQKVYCYLHSAQDRKTWQLVNRE
jgi:hypothetical protein